MELRQILQPMINELEKALEEVEKTTLVKNPSLSLHEHVYGWFLIRLETKIKRFIMEQERFKDHG